jgi:hypothetical protein
VLDRLAPVLGAEALGPDQLVVDPDRVAGDEGVLGLLSFGSVSM